MRVAALVCLLAAPAHLGASAASLRKSSSLKLESSVSSSAFSASKAEGLFASLQAATGPHSQPAPAADSLLLLQEQQAPPILPFGTTVQNAKITTDNISRTGLGENLPYPNIGYLGSGYDTVFGNPSGDPATQVDPGFREPLVQLTWDQNSGLSRDLRWLSPLEGWAREVYSCHMSSDVQSINSVGQYERSLQQDCSRSGGFSIGMSASGYGYSGSMSIKGDFSRSRAFNSFVRDTLSTKKQTFEVKSYCLQYQVGLDPALPWTVLSGPQAAMDSLKFPFAEAIKGCDAKAYVFGQSDDQDESNVYSFLQRGASGSDSLARQTARDTAAARGESTGPAPEVFHVRNGGYTTPQDKAQAVCATYNAVVATTAQLTAAHLAGADWCSTGWLSDSDIAMYPITTRVQSGCGGGTPGIKRWTPDTKLAAVNCFGIKPAPGTPNVMPFNEARWNEVVIHGGCSQEAARWLEFFRRYGTTIVTDVTFGGRMTYHLEMDSSEVDRLRKQGINVKSAFSTSIKMKAKGSYGGVTASVSASANAAGSDLSDKQQEEANSLAKANKQESVQVLGGYSPEDPATLQGFSEWSKSVADHPMPVKYSLAPIAAVFPKEKQEDVLRAAEWYQEQVKLGFAFSDTFNLEPKSATDMVSDANAQFEQVVCSGASPLECSCPPGKVVAWGFAIQTDVRTADKYPLPVLCEQGLASCVVSRTSGSSPGCRLHNGGTASFVNGGVDVPRFKSMPDGKNLNDRVEQVVCDPGCSVQLWRNANYEGTTDTYRGTVIGLGKLNNEASSAKVRCSDDFTTYLTCGLNPPDQGSVTQIVTRNDANAKTATLQCPSDMRIGAGFIASLPINGVGSLSWTSMKDCATNVRDCTAVMKQDANPQQMQMVGWAMCFKAEVPGIPLLENQVAATVPPTKSVINAPLAKVSCSPGKFPLMGFAWRHGPFANEVRNSAKACATGRQISSDAACTPDGSLVGAQLAWVACGHRHA